MNRRRFSLPPSGTLAAFESAARHANFSRAAEELNTSQSAISRHVSRLEARLGVRLFVREGRRVRLSESGEHLARELVPGLERVQGALEAVASRSAEEALTIACTHELSHLFIMPRFDAMQSAVGEQVSIRLMSYEYDALAAALDPRIDVTFAYDPGNAADGDAAAIVREAVRPLCSPGFRARHEALLRGAASGWSGLTALRLTKHNQGWATWDDWFERVGAADVEPDYVGFDNYVYLLEAAAAGRGLALGWRGLVDRHLESGTLVALGVDWEPFDRALHAVLTPRGRERAAARRCLEFLREPPEA